MSQFQRRPMTPTKTPGSLESVGYLANRLLQGNQYNDVDKSKEPSAAKMLLTEGPGRLLANADQAVRRAPYYNPWETTAQARPTLPSTASAPGATLGPTPTAPTQQAAATGRQQAPPAAANPTMALPSIAATSNVASPNLPLFGQQFPQANVGGGGINLTMPNLAPQPRPAGPMGPVTPPYNIPSGVPGVAGTVVGQAAQNVGNARLAANQATAAQQDAMPARGPSVATQNAEAGVDALRRQVAQTQQQTQDVQARTNLVTSGGQQTMDPNRPMLPNSQYREMFGTSPQYSPVTASPQTLRIARGVDSTFGNSGYQEPAGPAVDKSITDEAQRSLNSQKSQFADIREYNKAKGITPNQPVQERPLTEQQKSVREYNMNRRSDDTLTSFRKRQDAERNSPMAVAQREAEANRQNRLQVTQTEAQGRVNAAQAGAKQSGPDTSIDVARLRAIGEALGSDFTSDEDRKTLLDELRRMGGSQPAAQSTNVPPGGASAGSNTAAKTYTMPNGMNVTMAQIEATAASRGKTVQQVMKDLNIR